MSAATESSEELPTASTWSVAVHPGGHRAGRRGRPCRRSISGEMPQGTSVPRLVASGRASPRRCPVRCSNSPIDFDPKVDAYGSRGSLASSA